MYTFTPFPSNYWVPLVSACTTFHCSGAGASTAPPAEATSSTEPEASTLPPLPETEPSPLSSSDGPGGGSLPPAAAAAAVPSTPARQLLDAISGSSNLGDLPAAVGKISPQAKPEGRLGAVTTRLLTLMDLGLLGEEVLLKLHGLMPPADGDGECCAHLGLWLGIVIVRP